MVPASNSVDLAQRLPNARLKLHADAGHGGIFQYHEDFVPEVLVSSKQREDHLAGAVLAGLRGAGLVDGEVAAMVGVSLLAAASSARADIPSRSAWTNRPASRMPHLTGSSSCGGRVGGGVETSLPPGLRTSMALAGSALAFTYRAVSPSRRTNRDKERINDRDRTALDALSRRRAMSGDTLGHPASRSGGHPPCGGPLAGDSVVERVRRRWRLLRVGVYGTARTSDDTPLSVPGWVIAALSGAPLADEQNG
jgi:hypothetical protein